MASALLRRVTTAAPPKGPTGGRTSRPLFRNYAGPQTLLPYRGCGCAGCREPCWVAGGVALLPSRSRPCLPCPPLYYVTPVTASSEAGSLRVGESAQRFTETSSAVTPNTSTRRGERVTDPDRRRGGDRRPRGGGSRSRIETGLVKVSTGQFRAAASRRSPVRIDRGRVPDRFWHRQIGALSPSRRSSAGVRQPLPGGHNSRMA